MARYGMVIDTRRCVGCMDCVVACQDREPRARGVQPRLDRVRHEREVPDAAHRDPDERCNQCDDPPCVTCCPTGASHVEEFGALVLVTHEECIGCKACLASCPYDARFIHPEGYADKCTFCVHRLTHGLDPACVAVCPTHCMHFGTSTTQQRGEHVARVAPALRAAAGGGTKPRIFYLT